MKKKIANQERIYVSWNYSNHGTAYLKHILSAFYSIKTSNQANRINYLEIDQEEMQHIWDTNIEKPSGFVFDKVYLLSFLDKISEQTSTYRRGLGTRADTIGYDEEFQRTNTVEIWREAFQQNRSLEEERIYLQQQHSELWPTLEKQYWRNIQHYQIADQVRWFSEYSNAKSIYVDTKRFEHHCFREIKDSHNSKEIATNLIPYLRSLQQRHPSAEFIINVSLGSYEVQNVWYVLGEADLLPKNSRFISTYDRKTSDNLRFKPIEIIERDIKLVSIISEQFNPLLSGSSPARRLAYSKMKLYCEQGFSILILGERGTGKSHLVETIFNSKKKDNKGFKFAAANCASFDDDSKAEAELFGYEKGAFSGANERKEGLFQEAQNGILFFDEVHHLSLRVQAKLMKTLQTDQENKFKVRKLGSLKEEAIKCTLIFASNKPIAELKKLLLPDLFDRISQLVIEFPPLRNNREELDNDWKLVWQQLRFLEKEPVPNDKELLSWIKKLPLYGNYRDLQKIAVYHYTYHQFDEAVKADLGVENVLEFIKQEFTRYQSDKQGNIGDIFSDYIEKGWTLDDIEKDFRQKLISQAVVFYDNDKKKTAEILDIGKDTVYNSLKP